MNKDVPRDDLINSVKKYLSGFSKEELSNKLERRKEQIELSMIQNSAWLFYDYKIYHKTNLAVSMSALGNDNRKFTWSLSNKWQQPRDIIPMGFEAAFKPGRIPLPEAA